MNGVPLAHAWTFWKWDPATGPTTQKGDAVLRNVQLIDLPDDYWDLDTAALVELK